MHALSLVLALLTTGFARVRRFIKLLSNLTLNALVFIVHALSLIVDNRQMLLFAGEQSKVNRGTYQ